jgi:hypothetical protein
VSQREALARTASSNAATLSSKKICPNPTSFVQNGGSLDLDAEIEEINNNEKKIEHHANLSYRTHLSFLVRKVLLFVLT